MPVSPSDSSAPPQIRAVSSRVQRRYLLREERLVVSTRSHWAVLVEPVGTAAAALVLMVYIAWQTQLSEFAVLLWCVFVGLALRALWRYWNWRVEWFVATNRRLLRTYGVITQRVAMMPLRKVTDLSFDRSLPGRMLGYGEFVLESAGQDQALRDINFIPDPDSIYQVLVSTIFGPDISDPDEDGASYVMNDPSTHRDDQWEEVHRHELPDNWAWVENEANQARSSTRRRVAVDPDPTPVQ